MLEIYAYSSVMFTSCFVVDLLATVKGEVGHSVRGSRLGARSAIPVVMFQHVGTPIGPV